MICTLLFHYYELGFSYIKMHGAQMNELIFVYSFFFLIGILCKTVNCLTESWIFFSPSVNSFCAMRSVQKCYLLDMSKIFGFCTSLHHLQLSTFRFGCKPKFRHPKEDRIISGLSNR